MTGKVRLSTLCGDGKGEYTGPYTVWLALSDMVDKKLASVFIIWKARGGFALKEAEMFLKVM